MIINTREKKAFRTAKLEQYIIEESEEYKYDEDGEIIIDEFGEAVTEKYSRKTKVFTRFRYNIASQASIEKLQYIFNSWSQEASITIYTSDSINPKVNERVIINDNAYTIKRIYKDINDATAAMFNYSGFPVTYIELQGGLI